MTYLSSAFRNRPVMLGNISVVVMLIVLLTAVLVWATPAEQDKVVVVEMKDMRYHPDKLEVPVGTTVRWINKDTVDHNAVQTSVAEVNSGKNGFESPVLSPGQTWEFKFDKAGEYPVICTVAFHYMLGKTMVIHVTE